MAWILDLVCRPESRAAVRAICAENDGLQRVQAAEPGAAGVVVTSSVCTELTAVLEVASAADSRILVVQIGDGNLDPWFLLAAGAADYLRWCGKPEVITSRLTRIREVESTIDSRAVSDLIVGNSPVLRQALRDLVTAARFGNGPILVLGETGTGKELAARVAHEATTNGSGQLVVVDCTTIVPTLMGSELFGHERGAFTGAVAMRTGACSAADGGTLFLDEVGELPHELQPEIMRVVQEGTYKRVGGDKWYRSRFRLICATNRDLGAEVEVNRFRRDLYHRIASSTVTMPPLRDRVPDLMPLFKHFYAQARGERVTVELDPSVADAVCRRDYPGNLRDLKQLAYRVAARHVGPGPVTPGDLPPNDRPLRTSVTLAAEDRTPSLSDAVRAVIDNGMTLRELREEVAELAMAAALASSEGNVRAAAARLGVTDRALHLRRARNRIGTA